MFSYEHNIDWMDPHKILPLITLQPFRWIANTARSAAENIGMSQPFGMEHRKCRVPKCHD